MNRSPLKIINGSKNWRGSKPAAVALGNFDGVHCGHQFILDDLVRNARSKGLLPSVYTFEPHPAKILAPQSAPPLLQTQDQKIAALREKGIGCVILEKFDRNFSKLSPEQFFKKILIDRVGAAALWVGYNFTFGYKRSGTVEGLKILGRKYAIPLHVIPPQFHKGTLISSTQIRHALQTGNVEQASALLGRPFALRGCVIRGAGIGGARLGIHTANLKAENEILPRPGIYVTRTRFVDPARAAKKSWLSATSIGFNPTFPGKGFSVETHLIGFRGNLRGKKIEVAFLKWLREELTFPTPESLADQIHKDIAEAKKFNATLRHHR